MSYEPVDIFVLNAVTQSPVDAVFVRVYDAAGTFPQTEGTTGSDGRVSFLLPQGHYQMRLYKFSVSFSQPQHFIVESAPSFPSEIQTFEVKAFVAERPTSPDPRLCRASGFFRDASGHPRQYLDIHFIADFRPAIIDGSLVMDERRTVKTTKEGYGCIDLIRGSCYSVTMEDFDDKPLIIHVPDAPSVNLPDLLFPTVQKIVLGPVSTGVGQEVSMSPDVLTSTGVPLKGLALDDVVWKIEDPNVAQLTLSGTSLLVRGLSYGTTQLIATRKPGGVVKVPDSGIEGVPVPVVIL